MPNQSFFDKTPKKLKIKESD